MSSYRTLILATRHAVPPDSGYTTSVYGAVEQLVKQGVNVRVLFVDDGKSQARDYSAPLLAGIVPLPRWRNLTAMVRALATGRTYTACKWAISAVVDRACHLLAEWPFDLVQACGTFHMGNALAIKRRCGVKAVLRSENVEYAICQRMADTLPPGLRRLIWRRETRLLRQQEATWCRAANLCLPISDEDRAVLQALAPQTRMVTVQIGASVAAISGEPCTSALPPGFLHMGSLAWPPRLDGLLWFLHEVWPLTRARFPSARLLVAGSLPDSVRAQREPWRNQGVDVLGFVDDLAALAKTCASVVVPMRYGSGIKVRVLTAWVAGWPVVGTTGMGEGLPVQDGVNCLMTDEPAALAAAMQTVVQDPALRNGLIREGQAVIRRQFSWEAIGRVFQAAHVSILESW